MATVTLVALAAAVSAHSDEFKCTRLGRDSQNLKIEFADIKASAVERDGASRDEVKFEKLIRLCRALRKQGIPASLQAAWAAKKKNGEPKRDADGNAIYVPWPSIYVNNEARTNAERSKVVAKVDERMDRLEGMFSQLVQSLKANSPPTATAPTPEPETPEVAEATPETRPEF